MGRLSVALRPVRIEIANPLNFKRPGWHTLGGDGRCGDWRIVPPVSDWTGVGFQVVPHVGSDSSSPGKSSAISEMNLPIPERAVCGGLAFVSLAHPEPPEPRPATSSRQTWTGIPAAHRKQHLQPVECQAFGAANVLTVTGPEETGGSAVPPVSNRAGVGLSLCPTSVLLFLGHGSSMRHEPCSF